MSMGEGLGKFLLATGSTELSLIWCGCSPILLNKSSEDSMAPIETGEPLRHPVSCPLHLIPLAPVTKENFQLSVIEHILTI